MPELTQRPAIQEPIEIPCIKNTWVIKTEAAQFGIKPTIETIKGSKNPVESIKFLTVSSPTNSTIQPKIKLNKTIKKNIFKECIKGCTNKSLIFWQTEKEKFLPTGLEYKVQKAKLLNKSDTCSVFQKKE